MSWCCCAARRLIAAPRAESPHIVLASRDGPGRGSLSLASGGRPRVCHRGPLESPTDHVVRAEHLDVQPEVTVDMRVERARARCCSSKTSMRATALRMSPPCPRRALTSVCHVSRMRSRSRSWSALNSAVRSGCSSAAMLKDFGWLSVPSSGRSASGLSC